MSDYECPGCGGGFPATDAADDACPWCGEAMADGDGDDPDTPGVTPGPLWRRPVRRPPSPPYGRDTYNEPRHPTREDVSPIIGDTISTGTDTVGGAELDDDRDIFNSGIATADDLLGESGDSR